VHCCTLAANTTHLGISRNYLPSCAHTLVSEHQFGVSSFIYNHKEEFIVTVMEQISTIGLIDTKVRNMRMPWKKKMPSEKKPLGFVVCWKKDKGAGELEWKVGCSQSFTSQLTSVCYDTKRSNLIVGKASGEVSALRFSSETNNVEMSHNLSVKHKDRVTCVLFSERRDKLYTCGRDKTLKVLDMATSSSATTEAYKGWLTDMALDDEGGRVLVSTYAKTVLIYDIDSAEVPVLVHTLQGHLGSVRCVTYDPQIRYAFSGGFDCSGQVWVINTGNDVHRSRSQGLLNGGPAQKIKTILYIPEFRMVATGYDSGPIALWDTQGVLQILLNGHKSTVTNLQWQEHSRTLISSSYDGRVKFWKFPSSSASQEYTLEDESEFNTENEDDGEYRTEL